MLRGLYTAASAMATQRSKMDVVTNNIVNAQTTGFKKDTVISSSFDNVMLQEMDAEKVLNYRRGVGPYSFGTYVDRVHTGFSQGMPQVTGKQTDLAIYGDGFFVIETGAGERYTRAGNFEVDEAGYLVTDAGDFVLGENGRIEIGAGEFSVSSQGSITVDNTEIDKLRIVTFADPDGLQKQGGNLYAGAGAFEATEFKLVQGHLEGSNVEVADELVKMLTTYRAYEASQKVLTMTDDTLGLAVNDIGRLR